MKEELGYVYKITSPSGRIYVGSTKSITNRLRHYKNYFTKSQTKLHNSFLKYGYEAHSFEIIWTGIASERLKYESILGIQLNVLSSQNLNCKLPKYNEKIKVISEETRQKMSVSAVGRKMSKESKLKMSISAKLKFTKPGVKENLIEKLKKRVISDETKLKISINNKGKTIPIETREKIRNTSTGKKYPKKRCENISKSLKGRKLSEEHKRKISQYRVGNSRKKETVEKIQEANKKPIIQMDLQNNFIKEWKSATDASKELNLNRNLIGMCCKNKRNKHGMFKWKFKN